MDDYGGFNRDGGGNNGGESILDWLILGAAELTALVFGPLEFQLFILFGVVLYFGTVFLHDAYKAQCTPNKSDPKETYLKDAQHEIRRLKAELSRIEFPLQMRGEHRGLARGARGNPLNEHPQIKTLCHQISELEAKLKST